jgi:bifunctional non-homologous end joining protein LigD
MVSTPVTWDEVKKCLSKKDPQLLAFDSEAALKRVEKSGDIFEPVLKLKQKLPPLSVLGVESPKKPRKTASARERANVVAAKPRMRAKG